jgi:F-type H+-transporting ATPase subunit b
VWKFGWKGLVSLIDKRHEHIKNSLEHAEQTRVAVEQLEEEYKRRLDEIDKKSKELVGLAKMEAQRIKQELIDDAHKEVQQIHQHMKDQLEFEHKQMMIDLRQEIVQLSAAVAAKACSMMVDTTVHSAKFEEILSNVETSFKREKRAHA